MRADIAHDPLQSLSGKLHFTSLEIKHALKSGLGASTTLDLFDGVLLSMHWGGAAGYKVDGSAVLVAPGIALCATHVVSTYAAKLESGELGCMCMGPAKLGLQIWRVVTITAVPGCDLTILSLTYQTALPGGNQFNQATIAIRLPAMDEPLVLAGFRPDTAVVSKDGGLICQGNVLVSAGKVTAQYPNGRDTAVLPWPVVEVECDALGSMSGGPVFDTSGRLVGLVCSSLGAGPDGESARSYVSMIWPAMAFEFEGGWPEGFLPGSRSLLELPEKVCSIVGRDAIKMTGSGDTRAWQFDDGQP